MKPLSLFEFLFSFSQPLHIVVSQAAKYDVHMTVFRSFQCMLHCLLSLLLVHRFDRSENIHIPVVADLIPTRRIPVQNATLLILHSVEAKSLIFDVRFS